MHPPSSSAPYLLKQITSKEIQPSQLSDRQRKICMRYLMEDKPEVKETQAAELLGVHQSTISRWKRKIIEEDKWVLAKIDPHWYASHLQKTTQARINKIQQLAASQSQQNVKKAGELWMMAHQMEMDLAEKLFDLGILDRAPKPVEISGTVTIQELVKFVAQRKKDEKSILGRTGGDLGVSAN